MFAHEVARGAKPHEAYVLCGYSDQGAYQSANKLLKKADVSARIAEIRANLNRIHTEKISYTVVDAMAEAEEAFRVAKGKENGGAMVAAATLRAKLMGLLVEKKEIRTGPLDEKSDDELDGIIRDAAAEAKVSFSASGEGSETKH